MIRAADGLTVYGAAGALDAWAVERSGGSVEEMPVRLGEDTELVPASALTLRSRWLRCWATTPSMCPCAR